MLGYTQDISLCKAISAIANSQFLAENRKLLSSLRTIFFVQIVPILKCKTFSL